MKFRRALEDIHAVLFGNDEEKHMLYAVREGKRAAKDWYASHDESPTDEQLREMAYDAQSGDSAAFTGGFLVSETHRKRTF